MLCYILCFCGRTLGDIYPAFREMKKDLFEAAGLDDIIASNLPIMTEHDQPSLVPIFDQLDIHAQCCRTRLMGIAEFRQL